jgi:hypothetical protein
MRDVMAQIRPPLRREKGTASVSEKSWFHQSHVR